MACVTTLTSGWNIVGKLKELTEVTWSTTNDSAVHESKQSNVTTNCQWGKPKSQQSIFRGDIDVSEESILQRIQRSECGGCCVCDGGCSVFHERQNVSLVQEYQFRRSVIST
eukprot:14526371-Alexandrium_andersonii.AAC.1